MSVRPSQVSQRGHAMPFVACYRRAEREYAAALYVEACIEHGDAWQPISVRQMYSTLERLCYEHHGAPLERLAREKQSGVPWIRAYMALRVYPDVRGVIDDGVLSEAPEGAAGVWFFPVSATEAFIATAAAHCGAT